MSTSTSDHALADVLDELIDVRPFPATASRVMTACDKEDVTAAELSNIIEQDPVLTMKLLQIANSPMYGFSGDVRSVQHASVLIGLRALKNMAVSLAMGDVFGSGGSLTADSRDQLWKHALACGSIAKTLSAATQLASPDEAFLGGIVHDVGKLIFVDHRPEQYAGMLSCSCSKETIDAEIEAFGISHTAVGRSCGESWGLPEELSDVITFHHNPADSDFGGDLVDCVFAANQLSRIWLTDDPETQPDATRATEILKEAGVDLSPEEIETLRQQALVEVQAAQEVN
jgi:putative nucleotidyltransferase with HDIG domain